MKIIIASPHCANLDLIDIQFKSIKKYITDESYEYVIFNDGNEKNFMNNLNNINIRSEITNKCNELNIKCVEIPQSLHENRNIIFPITTSITNNHVSARASLSIQYIFDYYKNDDVILMMIESDMFFINFISVEQYLNNNIYVYLGQNKVNNNISIKYMWIGILIFNLSKLENKELLSFDAGNINGVNTDSGGHSYYFLEKNNQNCIKNPEYINIILLSSINKSQYTDNFGKLLENINNFYNNEGIFGEVYLNKCLFHIRTFGSNWNYSSKYFQKYLEYNNKNNNLSWDDKKIHWKNYCNILFEIFRNYNNSL